MSCEQQVIKPQASSQLKAHGVAYLPTTTFA